MKRILLLFSIFLLGCFTVEHEQLFVEYEDFFITIDDNSDDIFGYHIYFENQKDRYKSYGINQYEYNVKIKVSLFPGIYNIYTYGLVEKTSSSKKVYSFNTKKGVECFVNSERNILIKPCVLIPQADILENFIDLPILKVYMSELIDIFSLSSLSVKQGTDRVRSVTYEYDENDITYNANVSLYENGDWYMNISYLLKSKKDSNILEQDNIYISTSYFKNIFLGEYYF